MNNQKTKISMCTYEYCGHHSIDPHEEYGTVPIYVSLTI